MVAIIKKIRLALCYAFSPYEYISDLKKDHSFRVAFVLF